MQVSLSQLRALMDDRERRVRLYSERFSDGKDIWTGGERVYANGDYVSCLVCDALILDPNERRRFCSLKCSNAFHKRNKRKES